MNNNSHGKQRHSLPNEHKHDNKHSKTERMNKPLAIVNGQTIRSSLSTYPHFNEQNQFYTDQSFPNSTMKRKYDSSLSYDHHHHHHQPTKRFHGEQTLPMYPSAPLSSDSYYFDHPPTPVQQRSSRYMLLKNDPTLSETIPTTHLSTNFHEPMKILEHENLYSDDIEHLLDIFKNEVEMLGFDPVASTSTGDCLSSNEFCSY